MSHTPGMVDFLGPSVSKLENVQFFQKKKKFSLKTEYFPEILLDLSYFGPKDQLF